MVLFVDDTLFWSLLYICILVVVLLDDGWCLVEDSVICFICLLFIYLFGGVCNGMLD